MDGYGSMLCNDEQSFGPFGMTCGELRDRLRELCAGKPTMPVVWHDAPLNAQISIVPLFSTVEGTPCLRYNGLSLTLYRIGSEGTKGGEITAVDSHGLLAMLDALPYTTPFFLVPTGAFPPEFYAIQKREVFVTDGVLHFVL